MDVFLLDTSNKESETLTMSKQKPSFCRCLLSKILNLSMAELAGFQRLAKVRTYSKNTIARKP
jgi:hypothetical protein